MKRLLVPAAATRDCFRITQICYSCCPTRASPCFTVKTFNVSARAMSSGGYCALVSMNALRSTLQCVTPAQPSNDPPTCSTLFLPFQGASQWLKGCYGPWFAECQCGVSNLRRARFLSKFSSCDVSWMNERYLISIFRFG